MAKSVQGEKYTWHMGDDPIGSGDAGEVYTATCVQEPEITGVLKKPARIATGGTIQRQAKQIAQESLALQRLDGLPRGKAHPPRLIDQAPDFTQGTANFFIISETAAGKTMADLMAESRQTGKPFPRRVIITVLDALFDLFSRAHKAGVLWNDVKLEHIYWHNPTGQIGVIDWGNALFLDTDGIGSRPALPRWEDYQQMVDTLGGFLKQTAPDLFAELGWDEFQNQTLNSPSVSILARRIAFQQQVVTLRVMEYQSLIRVILTTDPSIEGLLKIQEYQQKLLQIGAPWESERVLKYADQLIRLAVKGHDPQTAVRATSIVWSLFDESLALPWHLLRAYFREIDLLSHQDLGPLIEATLEEQWENVLWQLIKIARESQGPSWWEKLVPVIRQQATGLIQARPMQICQSLRTWMRTQNPQDDQHSAHLDHIVNNWRFKGNNLAESPFDYKILNLMRNDSLELPLTYRADLRKSFAVGEESIRELIKFWEKENWEAIDQVLKRIAAWDPDRWGILNLAEGVKTFKLWLQTLSEGPHTDRTAHQFLDNLLAARPVVDRSLGTPPWLVGLLPMLQAILQGATVANYQAQIKHWCPWLLTYQDINTPLPESPAIDETELTSTLTNFFDRLKNWNDVNVGLAHVKSHSVYHYRFCKQLHQCFKEVFALSADLNHCQNIIEANCHPLLTMGCEVLQALVDWREDVLKDDLNTASAHLRQPQFEDWAIINQALQDTLQWQKTVLPALKTLSDQPHPFEFETRSELQLPEAMNNVFIHTLDIHQTWDRIYQVGLQPDVIERLLTQIEQARLGFFRWRHSIEGSEDLIAVFLYHHFLSPVREVMNLFSMLSQHIHQVNPSLHALENAKKFATSVKFDACENLLGHLKAIEALLLPNSEDARKFPAWQRAFQQIMAAESPENRQKMVLSLPDDHPLTTWLLQSTFENTP